MRKKGLSVAGAWPRVVTRVSCQAGRTWANHGYKHWGESVKTKLILALALTAATSGIVDAHHFLVASYQLDKTVAIEGTLDQFLFRNPHSYVQIKVADQAGRIEIRTVEWGSGGQLGRAGVSRDTLRPNDHVIVTGNPSRNPAEHMMRMVSIVRPLDGWKWNEEH